MNAETVDTDQRRSQHAQQPLMHGLATNMVAAVIQGLAVNTHGKVLVIGAIGGNFPKQYSDHPQLVFWEAEDVNAKQIPQAVRLVVMTRFIPHHAYYKVKDECDKRGIIFNLQPLGIGQIKALLKPMVGEEKRDDVLPLEIPVQEAIVVQQEPQQQEQKETTMAKLVKFERGGTLEFVAKHFNPENFKDKHVRGTPTETDRLHKLATREGYAVSYDVMSNAIFRYLEKQGLKKPEAVKFLPAPTPAPVAPPVTHPVTKVLTTVAKESTEDDEAAALLKMIDDASTTLQLAREWVTRRAADVARLKKILGSL